MEDAIRRSRTSARELPYWLDENQELVAVSESITFPDPIMPYWFHQELQNRLPLHELEPRNGSPAHPPGLFLLPRTGGRVALDYVWQWSPDAKMSGQPGFNPEGFTLRRDTLYTLVCEFPREAAHWYRVLQRGIHAREAPVANFQLIIPKASPGLAEQTRIAFEQMRARPPYEPVGFSSR